MNLDLFQFQMLAVQELRNKASNAIKNYRDTASPQVISLQAPTGSGKTTFILQKILTLAMKQNRGILILCNRSNLVEQYGRDLSKMNIKQLADGDFSLHSFMQAEMVVVKTYHALIRETALDWKIQKFGIIVCDEVHALYSDSQFATGLYVAFQKLVCWSKGRFMMYVTATGEKIFPLLHNALAKNMPLLYRKIVWLAISILKIF